MSQCYNHYLKPMSFRQLSQELKLALPALEKTVIDSNSSEMQSFESANVILRDYGPVMKVNLENISSGESSPCHSDNEKSSLQTKRKKDLSLYNILSYYLDSSSVEELKPFNPQSNDFDWVIIMGFLNDGQVTRAKEILANTPCKGKVRYAKRVYYKGFRSCLFECKSSEDAKYVLDFALNQSTLMSKFRTELWGLQLRSRFKDAAFQSSYNAIILKNIPPQFSAETLRQIIKAECAKTEVKSIDVLTLIENTIVTTIAFSSLEEAELMCQKLNNKVVQNGNILKVINDNFFMVIRANQSSLKNRQHS